MGISVGGLASGIDTESVISQLMNVEKRSILFLQRKQAVAQIKQQGYDDLNGRLESLRTAVTSLNDTSLFRQVSTSSSDTGIVTAVATKDAAAATHTLTVLQIATKHQIAAQGFVDDGSTGVAAAAGNFKFKIGGVEKTVAVNNTTTLRQFADAINATGGDVKAEVVNDGSSTNPYRLVLTSKKEGSAGQINITQNDTSFDFTNSHIEAATKDVANNAAYAGTVTSGGSYTGTGSTTNVIEVMNAGDPANPAGGIPTVRYSADGGVTWNDNGGAGYAIDNVNPVVMSNGVQATFTGGSNLTAGDRFRIDVADPLIAKPQDAVLKVNGINITKSSNTISDLYTGVTLQLHSAEAGQSVTVNVAQNVGDVESKLTNLVGAYNTVVGFLNQQFAYNPADDKAGNGPPALNGDSAARQVQTRLKSFFTGRIQGLTGKELSAVSEIGIESDQKTGVVSLNSSKLAAALADDPHAVERLLTRFGESMDGAKFQYLRRSAKSKPGEYAVNVSSPRSRADVAGLAAAEVLANDENLTVTFSADALNAGNPGTTINIALLAGDSASAQVSKMNAALSTNSLRAEAFLDASGVMHVRSKDFGTKYAVKVVSDQADGPGTTRLGNVLQSAAGTNLAGTIGGKFARVLDETHLKGDTGFDSQDVEIIVPNDTFGNLGKVRVIDGLGESLPDVIDSLSAGTGILKSRSEGIQSTIDDFTKQIDRANTRMGSVEDRLRKQFTNLEVTMGQLQALGSYVSAQLGGGSSK